MSEVDKSSKLSTGAIIGIIVGGVCFLVLCVASICYFAMGGGKRGGANGAHESQMGRMQSGPNFDNGNDTEGNYNNQQNDATNNDGTFNTTVTQGQP